MMFFFGRRLSKQAVNAVCVGAVVAGIRVCLPGGLPVHRLRGCEHKAPFKK